VYCTPYCSFFITSKNTFFILDRDEIFGCGLNNRGQLGIGTTSAVTIPTKLSLLSRKPIQKNDKLKNQSITIAERCTNSSSKPFYTDKSEDEGSLLNDGEYIVSISGGPYHTLALSSNAVTIKIEEGCSTQETSTRDHPLPMMSSLLLLQS
jgi:hypothetical protein